MKTRPRVGIDIDGVLIDSNTQSFLEFGERVLGWKIDYDVFWKTHSWLEAVEQTSGEGLSQAFEKYLASPDKTQWPIEGAHKALQEIGEKLDIFLITARTETIRKITEDFLKQHLRGVRYHEISMGNLDKKAQRIIDFNVDYYIDDSFREITQILQHSLRTTLIPFPSFDGTPDWQGIKDSRIHWLETWKNVEPNLPAEQQAGVYQKSWQEIADLILKAN